IWAVWCAEMPDAQLRIFDMPTPPLCKAGQRVRVGGRKSWCSGAQAVTHALVSARDGQDRQCLLAVAMDQPGVSVTQEGWQAVGMRDSGSVDVLFDDAQGTLVGLAGEYTGRPGFWHGAAGIAACWYGAMARIAGYLRHGSRHGDPYRLAHLGAVDAAVWGAAQVLRQAAGEIDAHPLDSCKLQVFRARLAVEAAAHDVMERASRGLGAGPLCRDAAYARLMADLPVFVRQSHAEHDQAIHGRQVLEAPQTLWEL
ncbi:MAG: acyl-CoA dehydrogenase family protein, partial [Pollutimonas bauzanensis]